MKTAEEVKATEAAVATVPAKAVTPDAEARCWANALENLRLMKKHAPKPKVPKRKVNTEGGPSTGPGTEGGAKAPRSKGPKMVRGNFFF